jgi:hypothetical protein
MSFEGGEVEYYANIVFIIVARTENKGDLKEMKHKRFKIDPRKQIGAKSNTTLFIFVSFAAILSVVVLGYLKLSDHGGNEIIGVDKEKGVVTANVVPSLPIKERLKKKLSEALPDGGVGMIHPDARELLGRWYTSIGLDGIAEFTFTSKGYELVYVTSPQSPLRQFSVGKYSYDPATGFLGLFPEYDAKPARPQEGAAYRVLTSRNFQMVVLKKPDESSLFMTAHERDLAGKNYHPIFLMESHNKSPVLEFMPVSNVK